MEYWNGMLELRLVTGKVDWSWTNHYASNTEPGKGPTCWSIYHSKRLYISSLLVSMALPTDDDTREVTLHSLYSLLLIALAPPTMLCPPRGTQKIAHDGVLPA